MKPFARLIPWIRHCTGHDAQQQVEQDIIPILRKQTNEDALSKIKHEEEAPVLLKVEQYPLGAHKSNEAEMDYTLPDLAQDEREQAQEVLEQAWSDRSGFKLRATNWNVVTAVYAVAAIAHTIIVFITVDPTNKEQKAEQLVIEAESQKEQQESISTVNRLHTAVRGYLNAESVQEKLQWVRHPDRVAPLMTQHYRENELENRKFKAVKNLRSVTAWSKSFVLIVAELESGDSQFLALEHGEDDSFKIDWETEVCYQPMAWKDFAKKNTTATVDMRVLARPSNHYNSEFSEDKDYVCFRMVSRDSKVPVYGYAKKNSRVWHDLRLFFTGKRQSSADGEPLILRLRIPEKGFAKNGVIIDRFLSDRWLYVAPPNNQSLAKAMVVSADQ